MRVMDISMTLWARTVADRQARHGCQPNGFGGASDSEPFDQAHTVHFDSPFTDAALLGNYLVRFACHQPTEDFPLVRTQGRDLVQRFRCFPLTGRPRGQRQRLFDGSEKALIVEWLFD